VLLTVVSIGLGQALITTETIIGVLHDNPTAGEGGVVGHILRRTVLAARFLGV
jgi:hypothetical protein